MRNLSIWLLPLALAAQAVTAASARLSFVEDDYPKALADARHRKLPIFVEVSAPW